MPRIGLLSDTHGRVAQARRAVALLLEAGAERIVHLGDVGGVGVLDELVVARPAGDGVLPVDVVFGNTDCDIPGCCRYAASLGLTVAHPAGRLRLPRQRTLAFLHGHDQHAYAAALADQVAYLCHGHTHRVLDHRVGPTRIINPGALFRAPSYTVALLDTEADVVQFLPVPAS